MSRYLKDKTIRILRPIVEVDEYNNHRYVAYEPIHKGRLWAYTRQLSMKEIYDYGLTLDDLEQLFIINYRSDLRSSMFIEYKDKIYSITRIDDFEGNKRDLNIYTKNEKVRSDLEIREYLEK